MSCAGSAHAAQQSTNTHDTCNLQRATDHRPEPRKSASVALNRALDCIKVTTELHRSLRWSDAELDWLGLRRGIS